MDTLGYVCAGSVAVDAAALAISVMTDYQDVKIVFDKASRQREAWRKKISIDYTRRSVPAKAIMDGVSDVISNRPKGGLYRRHKIRGGRTLPCDR